MYFLFLVATLYAIYYFYSNYVAIPDYPAFGESDYYDEVVCVNEVVGYMFIRNGNHYYFSENKEEFVKNTLEYWSDETCIYEVKYIVDDQEYICISKDPNIINLLPYKDNELTNLLFARQPKKAYFQFDNGYTLDISRDVKKLLGPNFNFHTDLTNIEVYDLLDYILYTRELFDSENTELECENYHLIIEDNLCDVHKYSPDKHLTWVPKLTTNTKIKKTN